MSVTWDLFSSFYYWSLVSNMEQRKSWKVAKFQPSQACLTPGSLGNPRISVQEISPETGVLGYISADDRKVYVQSLLHRGL